MIWDIGCSGFHYRHWKERFYPKGLAQKNWFDFYCQHFSSLELNVTFYRFPQPSFVEKWYNTSPDGFSFAVKAPRVITHYKQFIGTETMMEDFYGVVQEGLKEKLGCFLFQLPPRIGYTVQRLEKVINAFDKTLPNVIEFRHVSWWNETVYKALAKHKITFCGQSHPLLPDEVICNNKIVYYRMHGVPNLYQSPYEPAYLQKIVHKIKAEKGVKRVFIYFNNDIDASAIINAKQMQEMTGRH